MALGLAELYATVTQVGQIEPELFDLLQLSLQNLESHSFPAAALVWAELQLMRTEGVLPQWETCVETGRPIRAGVNRVSPAAGGLVDASVTAEVDQFEVAAEVLIGLARTAELDSPPLNLKRSEDCLWVLHRFWLHLAHGPLPAHSSLVRG